MAANFYCNSCGQRGTSKFDIAGSQVICEKCGQLIAIPKNGTTSELSSSSNAELPYNSILVRESGTSESAAHYPNPYSDKRTGALKSPAGAAPVSLFSVGVVVAVFAVLIGGGGLLWRFGSDSVANDRIVFDDVDRSQKRPTMQPQTRRHSQPSGQKQKTKSSQKNSGGKSDANRPRKPVTRPKKPTDQGPKKVDFHNRSQSDSKEDDGGPELAKVKSSDVRNTRLPPNRIEPDTENMNPGMFEPGKIEPGVFEPLAVRRWKAARGDFSVEASFVELTGEKVTLRKENGKTIDVLIDQLSNTDRSYAIRAVRANKLAEHNSARTEPAKIAKQEIPKRGEPRAKPPTKPSEIKQSNLITPNFAIATIVRADMRGSVQRDREVSKPRPLANWSSKINIAGGRIPKWAKAESSGFAFNQSGDAVLGVQNQQADSTWLKVFDLNSQKETREFKISRRSAEVVAISPSGNIIVTAQSSASDTSRLDFWKLERDQLIELKSWRWGSEHGLGKLHKAIFVDDGKLLTIAKDAIFWNIESDSAKLRLRCDEGTAAGIDQNREYVAWSDNDRIAILNLESMSVENSIRARSAMVGNFAFSPDRQHLATVRNGHVRIWNLQKHSVEHEFHILANSVPGSALEWPTKNYLVLNNKSLIDISLRTIIWNFHPINSGNAIDHVFGVRYCYPDVDGLGRCSLFPLTIPGLTVTERTAGYTPDELLLLKPGDSFQLEMDVPFGSNERNAIRILTGNRLKKSGFKLEENAELVIRMSLKPGRPVKVKVDSKRGYTNDNLIEFVPEVARIEMYKSDSLIWQATNRTPIPKPVSGVERTELEKRFKKRGSEGYHFLLLTPLPTKLARFPRESKLPGLSHVTAEGLVEQNR